MRKEKQIRINHKKAENKARRIISRALRAFVRSHPDPNPQIIVNAYNRLYSSLGLANAKMYWVMYASEFMQEEEMPPIVSLLLAQFISEEVNSVAYSVASNATKDFEESELSSTDYLKTSQFNSKVNTITRTEVTRALNKSALLAMEASGLPWKKAWVAIKDERTRNAHYEMNPKQFVPLEALFKVGNDLMDYPTDTSFGASIHNVINCRCGLTFKL